MGPPGWLFGLATIFAILFAFDANSRDSLWMLMVTMTLWFGIACVWLGRFVVAAQRTGMRMPIRHWARWLVIPLVLLLAFGVTRTPLVKDARLALSRPAMDAMVADVQSGGLTDRGWVGLFQVDGVVRTANGVRFVVDDGFLSRWGFAYASDGEPSFIDDQDEEAGLWTSPWFEPVGDGWWRWAQSWD